MIGWLRDFRVIPIMLIAAVCLLALKTMGLVFDGGYTLGERLSGNSLVVTTVPASKPTELRAEATRLDIPATPLPGTKLSWMQEMFNYPDITGSVAKPKPVESKPVEPKPSESPAVDKTAKKEPPAGAAPPDTKPAADGTAIPLDQSRPASPGERALLERLQERRQTLEARARELDLRESLLKAAEQKLEVETASQKASEAKEGTPGQRRELSEAARIKAVATMYETMKPKDAAKIFDRLDIRVLMDMATQINPRRMSEILAQMTPENAERLTVEMAARAGAERGVNPSSLPKIEGRPGGG
jgi:flagellar motility protein MotE (MotC chaperone)